MSLLSKIIKYMYTLMASDVVKLTFVFNTFFKLKIMANDLINSTS